MKTLPFKKFSILIGILALSSALAAEIKPYATKVTVLFTSDLHGNVLPYNYFTGEAVSGGFARYVTLIRQVRAQNPNTIVLDGGDTIQGTPLMNYAAENAQGEGNPMIAAMNVAGVEAMAVGNHEFNFGMTILRKAEHQANFPFLSANIVNSTTGESAFQPYVVLASGGLRIGVLGLTTVTIPRWELARHIQGLQFRDPVETAPHYIDILRRQENCDLVIVIFHSGFERLGDKVFAEGTPGENQAYELATHVEGIDLLLTGHTHNLVEPQWVGKTYAATCPAYARKAIRIDLTVERETDGTVKIGHEGKAVDITDSLAVDAEVAAEVKDMHQRTENYLGQTIAVASEELSADPARLYDTNLMDLLQAAQLEAMGADVSIASLLPWNGFEAGPGSVTVRQIFKFYPYENNLLLVEMNGRTLKDFLEHSARYYDGIELTGEGELMVKINPDVRPYNVDFVEGLRYRIDPSCPIGERIKDLSYHGKPLNPDEVLTVAVNNYRYSGGGGYDMLRKCRVIREFDEGVREILIDFIRKHGLDSVGCSKNWYVSPDLVTAQREDRNE